MFEVFAKITKQAAKEPRRFTLGLSSVQGDRGNLSQSQGARLFYRTSTLRVRSLPTRQGDDAARRVLSACLSFALGRGQHA